MKRILVCGCGSIGRRHLGNLAALGETDLVACDPNPDSRRRALEVCPQLTFADDPARALAGGACRAVLVCSPPQHHLPQLALAVEHGCHCFVEKPFALVPEGVAEVLRRADERGLVVATGFNMRFLDNLRRLKGWLDEGRLGPLISLRLELGSYMPNWHPWEDYRQCFMAFRASGGGALFDHVHAVDLAQWFAGPLAWVSGFQQTSELEMETDDLAVFFGQTRAGTLVSCYFDFLDRCSRKSIEIVGRRGSAFWKYDTADRLALYAAQSGEWTKVELKDNYARCYLEELRDFLACAAAGRKPASDGWNGLDTQVVLGLIVESARSGRRAKRP